MVYQNDFTLPDEIVEQIAVNGMDYLPELIRTMINTAMQIERQRYLKAGLYERNEERQGHANGYKDKTVRTRVVRIFPNEAACLRLVSAILIETSDEWEVGRLYLNLEAG